MEPEARLDVPHETKACPCSARTSAPCCMAVPTVRWLCADAAGTTLRADTSLNLTSTAACSSPALHIESASQKFVQWSALSAAVGGLCQAYDTMAIIR